MSESKIIKIPMSKEFYEELEEAFVDKDISANHFVWNQLKQLCKDAKAGKLAKSCTINVIENGQVKPDKVKLRDYDLTKYHLAENSNWVPEELEGEQVVYWEHKVTGKSYNYLHLYCEMIGIRFEKFNHSAALSDAERVAKAKNALEQGQESQKVMLQSMLDEETKKMTENNAKRKKDIPTCFEQAIYNQIYPNIYNEVLNGIDQELDAEFDEMYPATKDSPKR